MAKLFGKNKLAHDEIDPEEAGVSTSLLNTLKATNNKIDDNVVQDTDEALKNLSTLFCVDFNNFGSVLNGGKTNGAPYNQQHSGSSNSSTSGIRRRPSGSVPQCASKKRVLGQCAKCNKPVTVSRPRRT